MSASGGHLSSSCPTPDGRITAAQAFDVLRRASQHLNTKLREVARSLVETGETPAGAPGPPPPSSSDHH